MQEKNLNWIQKVEDLLTELIEQQQKKVLQTARDRIAHLTADDILNPQDYPVLLQDPIFNYEEGLSAGLMSAQMALRARILIPSRDGRLESL